MVLHQFVADLEPTAVVESEVTYLRHTWKFGDAYLGSINPAGTTRPISLWMVQRSRFDAALAQRALRSGAELRDGLVVRSLQPEADGITVQAQALKTGTAWTGKARYVIGADGANGVVVKSTQLRQQRTIAVALEVEQPHTWGQGHPDLRPEIAHLEYGAVNQGYAWIFPKGEHLNIGAGLFRTQRRDARQNPQVRSELRGAILGYMEAMGIPYEADRLRFHGHPLPIWSGKEPLQEDRILLVGDAAGLINPLFGDGILHALKSGQLAAQAIADDAAQTYTQRIHQEFAANFDAALHLARVFYAWPKLCYQYGVKYERATRIAAQLLCGELLFTDMTGRALRRLQRSVGERFWPRFSEV
jgi:flavin-dependent dehydrogenase